MKKTIAILLLTASFAAAAACPISAPYRCVSGWNGKMICGCGV